MRSYQNFGSFANPLFPSPDEAIVEKLAQSGNLVTRLCELKPLFEALRPGIESAVTSYAVLQRQSRLRRASDIPANQAQLPVGTTETAVTDPSATLPQSLSLSNRGRPSVDPVLMFKIVFLMTMFHLSDERAFEDILDRSSYRQFLDLGPGCCPSRQTIWKYREIFNKTHLQEQVSKLVMKTIRDCLKDCGDDPRIIDGSFTEAPIQHNTPEENLLIKKGMGNKLWLDQPHKKSHKDIDARWTKKGGESYFGYKIHVKVDSRNKLIIGVHTTPANVHDSRVIEPLLDDSDNGQVLYADAGYQGKVQEAIIRSFGMKPFVCEKAQRGKKLTEEQKANNRKKSRIRCRIEHVFGYIEKTMRGSIVRYIGIKRCEAHHWMTALCYNLNRLLTLKRTRQAIC